MVVLIVVALAAGMVALRWRRRGVPEPAPRPVISERTRASARAEARRFDLREIIEPGLRQPVTADNHASWARVLSTLKWTNYREPDSLAPLRAMTLQAAWPEETRRLLLETIYTLQPQELLPEMKAVAATDLNPRHWAMAAAYIRRATGHLPPAPAAAPESFVNDPRVRAARAEEREPRARLARTPPPLRDLLSWDSGGRPVVFSFQRSDRDFPGRATIRDARGDWVRQGDGALWSVPQLARSVSNLPGTITNGNTPAGVMGIRELTVARTAAIGPTLALTLALPDEYEAWTHEDYQRRLPPSWRAHWPMQEAWWAGQVGRTEIMAHGTTIDPEWWRGTPFHPLTPSHGCLTCDEHWSPDTGARLRSDQQSLADAVIRAGGAPAWFVVVEIDPPKLPVTPVSADEVAAHVADATSGAAE